MFDVLLGRSFAAKCKSLIKLTKNRIEVIRRKRRATEKFLKKDIADLLHSGLDINAYGRAEGLLVELILSSCYGFVEKSCELVLKHLTVMQKLSGCPEECRVAVSSLMFAAARFSDLPELRDLRQIFQERYGSSIECFVNQEFAANLDSKSSTLEKKVCLMQEIASEFSINWDSKAFKLRMSRPSAFAQDQSVSMRNNLFDYDKSSLGKDFNRKEINNDVLLENGKEAVILNRDYHDLQHKSTVPINGFKPLNDCEVLGDKNGRDNELTGNQDVTATKSDKSYWKEEGSMLKPIGRSLQEKTLEQFEDGLKQHGSLGNTTPRTNIQETTTSTRIGSRFRSNVKEPSVVNLLGPSDTDKPERKVQNDKTPMLKPCYSNVIPPPYVKHISKHQNGTRGVNIVSSHTDSDGFFTCPSVHENSDAASMSERIQIGLNKSDRDRQASRHERLSKQSPKKEFYFHEEPTEISMVKRKSTRRKHLRSRSSHYDVPNVDTELVKKTRSRSKRRVESRRGQQNLFDDEQHQNAEEERVIDKLLIHYSKKPSILKPEIVRKKSSSRHDRKMDNSRRELLQNGSGDGSGETPEIVTLALRSVSLPREQTRVVEAKKDFVRASSFQPDRSYEARHVHPKLPDYDDLATRLAALRGS
ncbi:uncharacterized protein LOC123915454 [Trifolium pratense]|uniref:uncharacterized protein LOC123915454 n=1 Tax=Trifolium pratense TaxID=57577 RepID=UPI001E695FF9|nr:uncharacterized protein LOC123915454 [Trifolium pratense]